MIVGVCIRQQMLLLTAAEQCSVNQSSTAVTFHNWHILLCLLIPLAAQLCCRFAAAGSKTDFVITINTDLVEYKTFLFLFVFYSCAIQYQLYQVYHPSCLNVYYGVFQSCLHSAPQSTPLCHIFTSQGYITGHCSSYLYFVFWITSIHILLAEVQVSILSITECKYKPPSSMLCTV